MKLCTRDNQPLESPHFRAADLVSISHGLCLWEDLFIHLSSLVDAAHGVGVNFGWVFGECDHDVIVDAAGRDVET